MDNCELDQETLSRSKIRAKTNSRKNAAVLSSRLAPPQEASPSIFERLIEPVSVDTFFREHLDKKPLYLGGRGSRCEGLFSWQDIEDIASHNARGLPGRPVRLFRTVAEGSGGEHRLEEIELPEGTASNRADWMRSRWRERYTFYFSRLDKYSTAIARLVQSARLLLNCEITASGYLTPANAQGLPPHYDTVDVLILQIHGDKRWRLRGTWAELPTKRGGGMPPGADHDASEVMLHPGDLLYLPRGAAHEVATGAGPSLHVTLQIYPYRWMDLVGELNERAGAEEPALRGRVPYGPGGAPPDAADMERGLTSAFAAIARKAELDAALRAHRRQWLEASTVTSGIFVPRGAAEPLGGDTLVRRTGECLVTSDGERARVSFAGCSVAAPLAAHEALQWIADARGAFAINALPSSLDAESKRVLVRGLLKDGLLCVEAREKRPAARVHAMTTPDFEHLIEPLSLIEFFAEHLDRKPLHLAGRAGRYAGLFSFAEMEDIAYRNARSLSGVDLRVFRMVSDAPGAARRLDELALPEPTVFDRSDWMRARYRDGYTFYFKQLHSRSSALARLAQELRLLLNGEVTVSAYLTPPHAGGLPGHYDTEDVLILQIEGAKHWRLYRGDWAELPAHRYQDTPPPEAEVTDVELRPGDLLYLPRGVAHEPTTQDEPSLHLTVAFYPFRWMELVKAIYERVSADEPALLRRVPCGPRAARASEAAMSHGLTQALEALQRSGVADGTLRAQHHKLLEASIPEGSLFGAANPVVSGRTAAVRTIGTAGNGGAEEK